MDYQNFIAGKHTRHKACGFDPVAPLPGKLHEWQHRVVEWCCRKGASAIFADCGLGKTAMQLAWSEQVAIKTGRPVLLLTPIAVGPQTIREADKFGITVPIGHGPDMPYGPCIVVLNYESLHKVDCSQFAGVCLDESSILKSFTGKIKRQLCEEFQSTPYKLACTATAAPNDHMELGSHSEFLGAMDRDVMLAKFFTHDSGDTSKWRLKRHGASEFWRWVASWAVCISLPSDVGGCDDGYALPGLHIEKHIIEDGTVPAGHLFRPASVSVSATNVHAVKRQGLQAKADRVANLVNGSPEVWTIWCDTDYEADALNAAIADCVEVRGSTKNKAELLSGFTNGESRRLITKPEIGGFGLNWQHCHNTCYFVGFSFERWYQSIRRHLRFGQEHTVNVHLMATDAEISVIDTLERKSRDHLAMQRAMSEAMRDGMREEMFGEPVRVHRPAVAMELPEWLKGGGRAASV